MKKVFIGTLVGAILVFGWQAVSNMIMHHHDGRYRTAANDEPILNALSANMKEEGQCYVPAINMNATAEEQQQLTDSRKGKPWAIIAYHPSFDENMGSSI